MSGCIYLRSEALPEWLLKAHLITGTAIRSRVYVCMRGLCWSPQEHAADPAIIRNAAAKLEQWDEIPRREEEYAATRYGGTSEEEKQILADSRTMDQKLTSVVRSAGRILRTPRRLYQSNSYNWWILSISVVRP